MRLAPRSPQQPRNYLHTLRLIRPPVIRAMATREFNMGMSSTCICGWAWREGMAYVHGQDPDDAWSVQYSAMQCQRLYGGTIMEWLDLYLDATTDKLFPEIEAAFVRRVRECVRP